MVIHPNGTQYWFINGKLHRDNDLPAVIWVDGDQFWYRDGKQRRDNDQPAVILRCNRVRYYYTNGVKYNPIKLHKI